jgi:myo-inositol 2-dehydrogenase / D-chiro-inositol 1-dehydrogenase
MRIGLAGAGRIGAFHAETLSAIPQVGSLVIADAQASRAADVAARLGREAIESPRHLFTDGIDGLVIAAATDAHADLIIEAVEEGIPVFCEKPVAPDIEGTLDVIKHIDGTDVPVQIGFQRRFDLGFRAAREEVSSGRLGWVHTVRAVSMDPAPPPPAYVAASGGLFRDCSVHDFDIIRWVTGHEVTEVYAAGANRGAEFFRAAGDVDTAAALLTLDDGTLALVSGTRYNAAGYDVRLEVLGSQDGVSVGLDDRLPLRSVEEGVDFPSGPPYLAFLDRFRAAYVRELGTFVDVVAGHLPSPCTVQDALAAFVIAEACDTSRREHRPVPVEEVRR